MSVIKNEGILRMKNDVWKGKYERDDGVGWLLSCGWVGSNTALKRISFLLRFNLKICSSKLGMGLERWKGANGARNSQCA